MTGSVIGVQEDDLLTFRCLQAGHQLRGETQLLCKQGRVEGQLPRCVKIRGGKPGGGKMEINSKRDRLVKRRTTSGLKKHLSKQGANKKQNEKLGKLKKKKKYLKSIKDLMLSDQPPGLGIPYGNDVVGHQDQLVLLEDYDDMDDGQYDVEYVETGYEDTEDYEYEGEYEEYSDTDYKETLIVSNIAVWHDMNKGTNFLFVKRHNLSIT